ncbi:MAG TPA: DUF6790 family protein [Planctomycetota bacterium]|jgi:hypothetical protein|nr:DUF6790 family protein [Planctomycetota bacterium]
MFRLLFACLLTAGRVHALQTGPRKRRRFVELRLVHPLVGYFGFAMLAAAAHGLAAPERFAASHGWRVSADKPFQRFAGLAYGSMALAAILAARLRGLYRAASAVCGSGFFLEATWIRLAVSAARGRAMTLHRVAAVFANHGLLSVVRIAPLVACLSPERANRPG